MQIAELAEPRRDEVRAEAVRRADTHETRHWAVDLIDDGASGDRDRFHALRVLQQRVPERRQRVACRVPIEQLRGKALFEAADAASDGRVVRAQATRRAREGALPRDREKKAQIVPPKSAQDRAPKHPATAASTRKSLRPTHSSPVL